MKYEFQKKQAQKVAQRNKNIRQYSLEHPDSSQADIGKIFHLTGGRISQVLLNEKNRLANRAISIARENQNTGDRMTSRE